MQLPQAVALVSVSKVSIYISHTHKFLLGSDLPCQISQIGEMEKIQEGKIVP